MRQPKPQARRQHAAFERYKKLSLENARNIVAFYERRMSLRAEADDKNKDAPRPVAASDGAIDDDIVVIPSPSIAALADV
jgi:hypothetical protein